MTIAKKYLKILIIDEDNPAIHADFIKILSTQQSLTTQHNRQINGFEKPLSNITQAQQQAILPPFKISMTTQIQAGLKKIATALKKNTPYALILIDIKLSSLKNGKELIKEIWQLDQNIQIVICCSPHSPGWETIKQKLGNKDKLLILNKPFDDVAIQQLSCSLIKTWQSLQTSLEHLQFLESLVEKRTQSLQKSLSVSKNTLESLTDGILILDNNNNLIDYNQKLVSLFQLPKTLLAKKDTNQLLQHIAHQMNNSTLFLEFTHQLTSQKNSSITKNFKSHNNQFIEIYTQTYNIDNQTVGRIWFFRDITERILLEEHLQYQATHDTLTQLPNRRLLLERINQSISYAKRNNSLFAFIFFDLDHFKLVNDSYSHIAGDQLLCDVVKRWQSVMRTEDTLARLGGDEFIAVIESLQNYTQATKIANKLLSIFDNPFIISGQKIQVTASLGIAIFPHDGQTFDELLRNADMAMYNAKEHGGNQFQFYSAELSKKSAARIQLESELYQAIEKNEFFLCYQPQFDLTTHKLAAEALIRWRHPQRGILLPIDFIPLAEETGLILPIDQWVLNEACRQNKQWQQMGYPKIRVAVNLSNKQLKQTHLACDVQAILNKTGLEPQYLELEIHENNTLTHSEAESIFRQFKRLGVHFTWDDFGANHVSFNNFKLFPIDKIKIDHSYVNNINVNKVDEVIIQAIISLAKSLNLEVVAEGVESKMQVKFLQDNHCDEMQGYYFSKPLNAEDFTRFLHAPSPW